MLRHAGHASYLDVIGVNYYPWNQWYHPSRSVIPRDHTLHRPLRDLFRELHARYGRPLFVAGTEIEDDELRITENLPISTPR